MFQSMIIISDVFTVFGRQVYCFGSKTLFKIFFQLYFNKTFFEVGINEFTMFLIILNGLEDKNADRREKQRGQKRSKQKKNFSIKVFSFI